MRGLSGDDLHISGFSRENNQTIMGVITGYYDDETGSSEWFKRGSAPVSAM